MGFGKLLFREIAYTKTNFALGCFAVCAAAAGVVAAFAILDIHDDATKALLKLKVEETEKRVAGFNDDMRKITKKLGFNVLILPENQNLEDFYSDTFASKYMPENDVKKLAASRIVTVRHLLPTLESKTRWPERGRTIILTGIRGEVPLLFRSPKTPIIKAVKPGSVVVGSVLAQKAKLRQGQDILFMGKRFTVAKVNPERGDRSDIAMWMDLERAQELLGKKGLINGIFALECKCSGSGIEAVRRDIAKILPGVKVIGFANKAEARRAARDSAEREAKAEIAHIRETRSAVRRNLERVAAALLPSLIAIAALWLAALSFSNARSRRYEVALLAAIGVPSKGVFGLFIARAAILALFGAVAGVAGGLAIAVAAAAAMAPGKTFAEIIPMALEPTRILGVVILAPVLAMAASWAAAGEAARRHPSDILREE